MKQIRYLVIKNRQCILYNVVKKKRSYLFRLIILSMLKQKKCRKKIQSL